MPFVIKMVKRNCDIFQGMLVQTYTKTQEIVCRPGQMTLRRRFCLSIIVSQGEIAQVKYCLHETDSLHLECSSSAIRVEMDDTTAHLPKRGS